MNDYAHHLIKIEQFAKRAHEELEDKRFYVGKGIAVELMVEAAQLIKSIDCMALEQHQIEERARRVKS